MSQGNISESVTFEEAIAFTQSLLEQISTMGEAEIEEAIASLVKSENGARGFFVTYLTSEHSWVEQPTEAVIRALKTSPSIVSELLVKNLAMSAAMSVTHHRNQDQEMVESSKQVCQRSANLIKQVQLEQVRDKLAQLQTSLFSEEGNYQEFLQRWGYDDEQKKVINTVIEKFEINNLET